VRSIRVSGTTQMTATATYIANAIAGATRAIGIASA
jgi:hypothetical protein